MLINGLYLFANRTFIIFNTKAMRPPLIIFLTLFCFTSFAQTVEELEYELSFYKSEEKWGNKKDVAYKLLEVDGLNNKAISYLTEVYGTNNEKDSINILFDYLININPENPTIYLIIARERNAHFAKLTDTERINYMKKAKEFDNNNIEATYSLAKQYYKLFINEFRNKKKKTNLDYYSKNSINYFLELCSININYSEISRLPLIQLYNYRKEKNNSNKWKSSKFQTSFFPIYEFSGLPKKWETNFSVNIFNHVSDFSFSGIEGAIFKINWYSSHLLAMDEPVLIDTLPTKIYRFTYLRTFDNPIVIRLENLNDTVSLHWKVSDGKGGYEPGEIIINKSKELTTTEWDYFESKIKSLGFWELPTLETDIGGQDGSQWILEGKYLGKYKVVDRWSGGEIKRVCKELLNLTDLLFLTCTF